MRKAVGILSRTLGIIAATLLFAMVLLVTADVVVRELTGTAIPGVVDYSEIFMVGLVFLGLAYAQSRRAHINALLVTTRLPRRLAGALYSIGLILVCLFVAWFLIEATERAIRATISGEVRWGIAAVPIWPARVLLALGVFALLLELLLTTFDAIQKTITGRPVPEIHGTEKNDTHLNEV